MNKEDAAQAELREKAYQLWIANGKNASATKRSLDRLKESGQSERSVSLPTLGKWRREFGWNERSAKELTEIAVRMERCSDEVLLEKLLKQEEHYSNYFENMDADKINPQATYAYEKIIRTIMDMRQQRLQYRMSVYDEFLNEFVIFLREKNPDAAGIIVNYIEAFTTYIRKEYVLHTQKI